MRIANPLAGRELFGFLKNRRRRKILASPFPGSWRPFLHRALQFSNTLPAELVGKLEGLIQVIVAERHFEGCEGFVLNDEVRVVIAANASLLLLGTNGYYFDTVPAVLVFEKSFNQPMYDGTVNNDDFHASGVAYESGQIVLSWQDVVRGSHAADGYNVVIHEFAHHLDGLDGEMGGSLPFDDPTDSQRWHDVASRELTALKTAAKRGQRTLLDHYGATNLAELFAVASENFFERPVALAGHHPELFELLRRFYKIDPTQWPDATGLIER